MPLKTDQLYRKQGRRYVPCGLMVPDLPNGLYLVETNKVRSVAHWLSEVPDIKDVQSCVKLMMTEDKIIEAIKGVEIYGTSRADLARRIIQECQNPTERETKRF